MVYRMSVLKRISIRYSGSKVFVLGPKVPLFSILCIFKVDGHLLRRDLRYLVHRGFDQRLGLEI